MFITDPNVFAYQNHFNQTQIRGFGPTNVPTWNHYVPFGGVPYNTVQQNYGVPSYVQQPINAYGYPTGYGYNTMPNNYGYNAIPNYGYGYNYNYGVGCVPVQMPNNVSGTNQVYGSPVHGGWQQNVQQQQPIQYAFPWYGQQQGFVQGFPQQVAYQGYPYAGQPYQGYPIQQQGYVQGIPNTQAGQQGPINQSTGPQGQQMANGQ